MDSSNFFQFQYNPPGAAEEDITLYSRDPAGGSMAVYQATRSATGWMLGQWVPISISMFRTSNPDITPPMETCTVLGVKLIKLAAARAATGTFTNYAVTELTIPGSFVGLLSDITIYKTYIINPWSFSKWGGNFTNNQKFVLYTFAMKSTNAGQSCLLDTEIDGYNVGSLNIRCIEDYNEYQDTTYCGGVQGRYYLDANYSKQCSTCCCDNNTYCVRNAACGGCNWENYGCEYNDQSLVRLILQLSGNGVQCRNHYGFDAHRFANGQQMPNIVSYQGAYSMNVWVLTQSYVRDPDTVTAQFSLSNFSNFEIAWNYHTKFKFSYTRTNATGTIVNRYYATCYPMADLSNPNLDGTGQTLTYNSSTAPVYNGHYNRWVFFACGVDPVNKTMYISQNNINPNSSTFTSTVTIPSGLTTLKLTETSVANYGMTFFRRLRLWNCYDCGTAYIYLPFVNGDSLFANLLHSIDSYNGADYTGVLTDEKSGTGATYDYRLEQRAEWVGYNTLNLGLPNNPLICDERTFAYKNKSPPNPAVDSCICNYTY